MLIAKGSLIGLAYGSTYHVYNLTHIPQSALAMCSPDPGHDAHTLANDVVHASQLMSQPTLMVLKTNPSSPSPALDETDCHTSKPYLPVPVEVYADAGDAGST